MHWISALLTSAAAATAVGVSVSPKTDEGPSREPADRFYIEHDGKRVDVRLGEKFTLTVDGEPVEIELQVEPNRIFETDTFRFEYPRGMAYSYDGDAPESWDLESGDVTLSLQLHQLEGFDGETLFGLIVNAIGEQYGDGLQKTEDATVKLGSKEYPAKRFVVQVLGEYEFVQSLALIPSKGEGQAWIIVLTEAGDAQSAETKRFRKLLETTWVLR